MPNSQNTATIRNPMPKAAARRPGNLQDLVRGLSFALAFSFTAAIILGVVR